MTATTETGPAVSLRDYLGTRSRDGAFVDECEASAEALVSQLMPPLVSGYTPEAAALRRQAVLATGANLWQRRRRLTEAAGFTGDGQVQAAPERPTRDPLDAARHILAAVLGPGIA